MVHSPGHRYFEDTEPATHRSTRRNCTSLRQAGALGGIASRWNSTCPCCCQDPHKLSAASIVSEGFWRGRRDRTEGTLDSVELAAEGQQGRHPHHAAHLHSSGRRSAGSARRGDTTAGAAPSAFHAGLDSGFAPAGLHASHSAVPYTLHTAGRSRRGALDHVPGHHPPVAGQGPDAFSRDGLGSWGWGPGEGGGSVPPGDPAALHHSHGLMSAGAQLSAPARFQGQPDR